jgi:PAS domain S-box-containing protein
MYVVHTDFPAGSAGPADPQTSLDAAVAESARRPLVFPLRVSGPTGSDPIIPVRVAIEQDGSFKYLLTVSLASESLNRILLAAPVPVGWTLAVIDPNYRIAARNRAAEQFVGREVTSSLKNRLIANSPGVFQATTQEGALATAAFHRSTDAGWSVVIGMPPEEIDAPVRRSLALVIGLGIGAGALGAGLGAQLAMRLRRVRDAERSFARELERRIVEQTQALRDSEQRFRTLTEMAPVGIFRTDADGRVSYANSRLMAILGSRHDDVLEDQWIARIHLQDRALVADAWHDAVRRGRAFSNEYRLIRLDGETVWVFAGASPVVDAAGKLDGFVGTVMDMTDRKIVEESLRLLSVGLSGFAGEEFFAVLARNLARILRADIAFVGSLGAPPLRRVRTLALVQDGRNFANIEYDPVGAPCERVLRGEEVIVAAGARALFPADRYLAEHGIEAYVALPLADSTNRIIGHVGVMFRRPLADSERVVSIVRLFAVRAAAEFTRHRAEQKFRDFFEMSADGIVITDRAGRIQLVNQAAERLSGYGREELLDRPVEVLVPEQAAAAHPGHRQRYQSAPVPRAMMQGGQGLSIRRKDGSIVSVEINLNPLSSDDELLIVATIRDITEKVATAAQLQQAQKMEMVGQLTGGVAHDFNNLLGVIIGNLDLLDGELPTDAPYRELVGMALSAAERGATLTKHLLMFARRETLHPQAVNVSELVKDTARLLTPTLGEPVEVVVRAAEGVWPCAADPGQLQSTILNLAINARDAMPNGGTLTIETGNVGPEAPAAPAGAAEQVMIAVSDTGIGMAPEVLERCLEPFFTTKEVGKGSGLGLSMVYGFVKQSGGDLRIVSAPGRGTTVKIYLPRIDGRGPIGAKPNEARPNEARPPAPMHGGGAIVLVVEDNAEMRKFSVNALKQLGYRLLEVDSGLSALSMVAANPGIAIILTDVVLGSGMSGVELARAVLPLRPDLRILLMSGYTGSEDIGSMLTPGKIDFIKKPFRIVDLGQRLARLAGNT